jgi:hypothetical protein
MLKPDWPATLTCCLSNAWSFLALRKLKHFAASGSLAYHRSMFHSAESIWSFAKRLPLTSKDLASPPT